MTTGSLVGDAVTSGEPRIISDIANDPNIADWRDAALQAGFKACRAQPLFSKTGKAVAAMVVFSADRSARLEDRAGSL